MLSKKNYRAVKEKTTFDRQLDAICAEFGTATQLADILGIVPHAISNWRKRGWIPAHAAIEIDRLTDGAYNATALTRSLIARSSEPFTPAE